MICEFFGLDSEYQENALARAYRRAGHHVVIATSTYESLHGFLGEVHAPGIKTESAYHGARVLRLPYAFNVANRLRPLRGFKKLLYELKPDLVYLHDIGPNIVSVRRFKKRFPDSRIILDYHADAANSARNWLSKNVLHGLIRRSLLRWTLPAIEAIFPIVPHGADFLAEVYGIKRNEMAVLPLGFDDVEFGDLSRQTDYSVFRVVSGGKIDELKRTKELVEALVKLADPRIELHLFGAAGPGSQDYYLSTLKVAEGLGERFVEHGWLTPAQTAQLFKNSDLAVFPASQSILWQTAIGCGLPLIVGNSGIQSVRYLNLHNNIVELQAKEISADRIALEIANLVNRAEVLQSMKDGAQKVAAEYLNIDSIALRTLSERTR